MGRYDIPQRDGVLYLSASAAGAIAEIIQGFRGREAGWRRGLT